MKNKTEQKEHIQLIKTLFVRGNWKENEKDVLYLIYKDELTNTKKISTIVDPKITFRVLNKKYPYHKSFVKLSETTEIKCFHSKIYEALAEIVNKKHELYNWRKTKQASKQRLLHTEDCFYNSDIDIQDYYIKKFYKKFKSINNTITKGYLDIETDISQYEGFPDPEIAPCPINIITYNDDIENISYTFILRNKNIPELTHIEKNKKKIERKLKEVIFKDDKYLTDKYVLSFFDNEVDLLATVFSIINQNKPDFSGSWNARFDNLTMVNRLEKHYNIPAADIMCNEDFSKLYCYYKKDHKNDDPQTANDEFLISSYTNFVDLLGIFKSLRTAEGKRESYALGDIATDRKSVV